MHICRYMFTPVFRVRGYRRICTRSRSRSRSTAAHPSCLPGNKYQWSKEPKPTLINIYIYIYIYMFLDICHRSTLYASDYPLAWHDCMPSTSFPQVLLFNRPESWGTRNCDVSVFSRNEACERHSMTNGHIHGHKYQWSKEPNPTLINIYIYIYIYICVFRYMI